MQALCFNMSKGSSMKSWKQLPCIETLPVAVLTPGTDLWALAVQACTLTWTSTA